MQRNWRYLWTLSFVLANPLLADEPPVKPGIKQQRVSPKLLREALNLPEYKAQTPSPSPTIEPLQRLSDKLKTNGDQENHELLERFISSFGGSQLRFQTLSLS